MRMPRVRRLTLSAVVAALAPGIQAPAIHGQVPTPADHFGFPMGAERQLANWDDLTSYYEVLAHTSDRVTVDTLGPTTRGRPFVMLTITSPANHARLAELQGIQRQLSDPRTVEGRDDLDRLLTEGRTVVMITHGIHSTEGRRRPVGRQTGASPRHVIQREGQRDPRQRDPAAGAVTQPRRNPVGQRLLQRARRYRVRGTGAALALPVLHRSRQQPRLVHLLPERNSATPCAPRTTGTPRSCTTSTRWAARAPASSFRPTSTR